MFIQWLSRQGPLMDGDGGGSGTRTPEDGFSRFLERHGGSYEAAARALWEDNYDYRKANRTLTEERDNARKLIPAEGAVVLAGDALTQYNEFKALNLKPAEIQSKLKDAETSAADLAKERKVNVIREAAAVAGWKPEVLTRYGGNLDYEIREVETNGTKSRQVFVKDGDQVKPASEHFADLLPALAATPQPEGTRYPAQHSSSSQGVDPVDDFVKRANEERGARPNPLAPRTA